MPKLTLSTQLGPKKFSLIYVTFFSFFLLMSHVVASYSQELIATTINNELRESFDAISPVSGIPLAGLTMGKEQGNLDINNVKITTPLLADRLTCIIARTRDGRYYSENPYIVPAATQNASLAKIAPATQKYARPLSKYKDENYALIGRLVSGNNCEAAADMYLPRVTDPKSSELFMYINSGSGSTIVTATLLPNRDERGTIKNRNFRIFHCNLLTDGANIAFDTECSLDVAPFMGQACQIEVQLDDGIEPEPYRYTVLLPSFRREEL